MGDVSGWAQALVGAVAILASGYISTRTIRYERKLARQEENRRRLDITTIWWPPTGLQLDFRYLPEFTHIGLRARVKLLSPSGAIFKELRHVTNTAPVGGRYSHVEQGGPFIGDGLVRLVGEEPGQPFTGSIIILSPEGSREPMRRARIRVVVETDAGELLLTTEMAVSPIEQAESFWMVAPGSGSPI